MALGLFGDFQRIDYRFGRPQWGRRGPDTNGRRGDPPAGLELSSIQNGRAQYNKYETAGRTILRYFDICSLTGFIKISLWVYSEDQHVLAVLTFAGRLSLIKGFDDVHPCCCPLEDAALSSPLMEWNNEGELLCLAGHSPVSNSYANVLRFYNSRGVLRFRIAVPYTLVILLP